MFFGIFSVYNNSLLVSYVIISKTERLTNINVYNCITYFCNYALDDKHNEDN
jgi:hypothetical protein